MALQKASKKFHVENTRNKKLLAKIRLLTRFFYSEDLSVQKNLPNFLRLITLNLSLHK